MYLKHPAWLWLKKHDKTKLPEIDANQQAMFDAGHEFETYAEQLFPEGQRLGFHDYQEYLGLPAKTKRALDSEVPAIFQGRLEADDITCIFDVLRRQEDGGFDLYEIKSSTKVKDEHLDDLAFQIITARKAGVDIRRCFVVYVNKHYIRRGEVNPHSLATIEETTDRVEARLPATRERISEAFEIIRRRHMPDPSLRYCSPYAARDWLEVYRQLATVPEDSIYNLFGITPQLAEELETAGIERMAEIPEHTKLSQKQKWQVEAIRHRQPDIDRGQIRRFLDDLTYPLHFLDYETLGYVVPPFNGMRPYQQLPFQYSLHIVPAPGAEPEHREYLHTKPTNPVRPLLQQLTADIDKKGSVLVWSKSFEQNCNTLMGELEPDFQNEMQQLNDRIIDLMDPFAKGWFIDHRFGGSASIKYVLPVLAPDLSYGELDIQEGGSAQRLWQETVLGSGSDMNHEQLFANLRQYCALDTLAMVRIHAYLHDLPESTPETTTQGEQTALF